LDETFYAALKSTKNSNASMPNIDQLEKKVPEADGRRPRHG
jgi:hypothetical protein